MSEAYIKKNARRKWRVKYILKKGRSRKKGEMQERLKKK